MQCNRQNNVLLCPKYFTINRIEGLVKARSAMFEINGKFDVIRGNGGYRWVLVVISGHWWLSVGIGCH